MSSSSSLSSLKATLLRHEQELGTKKQVALRRSFNFALATAKSNVPLQAGENLPKQFLTKKAAAKYYMELYGGGSCHPQAGETCCFDSMLTALEAAMYPKVTITAKEFNLLLKQFLKYGCADNEGDELVNTVAQFSRFIRAPKNKVSAAIISALKKSKPIAFRQRYKRGTPTRNVGLEVNTIVERLPTGPLVTNFSNLTWGAKIHELVPAKPLQGDAHCTTVVSVCTIGTEGQEKLFLVIKDTNTWGFPKSKDWPSAPHNCICFVDVGKLMEEQKKREEACEKYADDADKIAKNRVADKYFVAVGGVQFRWVKA